MLPAKIAMDNVGDRLIFDAHMDEVFLRLFHSLRDRSGHLRRLPFADPYPAATVSHHHQRTEVEAFAALDHLRHAVNKDNLIFKTQRIGIDSHRAVLLSSEFETVLPRGFS